MVLSDDQNTPEITTGSVMVLPSNVSKAWRIEVLSRPIAFWRAAGEAKSSIIFIFIFIFMCKADADADADADDLVGLTVRGVPDTG